MTGQQEVLAVLCESWAVGLHMVWWLCIDSHWCERALRGCTIMLV